jgi:hypothetical protein
MKRSRPRRLYLRWSVASELKREQGLPWPYHERPRPGWMTEWAGHDGAC